MSDTFEALKRYENDEAEREARRADFEQAGRALQEFIDAQRTIGVTRRDEAIKEFSVRFPTLYDNYAMRRP